MKAVDDGKYIAIVQDDYNFVVYPLVNGEPDLSNPLWDRWSYEATPHRFGGPPPPTPDIPNVPTPRPSLINTPIMVAANINPIGMAYWRNINNHRNRDSLYMFLSDHDELTLYVINKPTLNVTFVKKLGIHHTGEGCYFSTTNPNLLFVPTNTLLFTIDVETLDRQPVWRAELGKNLWQCHSSYDEKVHSASIQDLDYKIVKWGVLDSRNMKLYYYDVKGTPDECQIDKSGQWLLIKEDDYNRIVHVPSGNEKMISDEGGAVGHSDCGFGFAMGEFDKASRGGVLNKIDYQTGGQQQMFATGIWNMGYVSFTNATSGVPLEQQHCLMTTPSELILVQLDGQGSAIKVCDHMTESQQYEHRPKANLCPLGEYAAFTSFVKGSMNAYIVRMPN